jgi:hypothetical protein
MFGKNTENKTHWTAEEMGFDSGHNVHTGSVAQLASILLAIGTLSLAVKWLGREADH